uniref:Uncharacterized protein n=1 Tax=Rhizophora mucronata TaxID=61149 RepID=A0A2P2NX44_RHIMU
MAVTCSRNREAEEDVLVSLYSKFQSCQLSVLRFPFLLISDPFVKVSSVIS